jgi:hypothetical protein
MRGMEGGAVQVACMVQGGAESGALQSSRPRGDDNVGEFKRVIEKDISSRFFLVFCTTVHA